MVPRLIFAGCLALFCVLMISPPSCPAEMTICPNINIREIGRPVHGVNWINSYVGKDKFAKPSILTVMGQDGGNFFVLEIDPNSGRFLQFFPDANNCSYPTAKFLSKTGKLYIGSAYGGDLFIYDPNTRKLQLCGNINGENAAMPCGMTEDDQGRIWIGSYPGADLTSYDPETGKFNHFGRMDESDMYAYPYSNKDGKIAVKIKTLKPHVIILDPNSGTKYTAGPVIEAGSGSLDVIKALDGWLYIRSTMGKFRLEGFNAVEVNDLPSPIEPPALPDGQQFEIIHSSDKTRRMLIMKPSDGKIKTFNLPYETTGSRIAYLAKGSDDTIYGSSTVPMHLFRYDTKTTEFFDLGTCSGTTGELCSTAVMDSKMYLFANNGAYFSVYDPAIPYRFGKDPNANPRDLGRIDPISCKPRSALAGPMQKIWVASIPDYGKYGGPLSYFDPKTGEKKSYQMGNASCFTLAEIAEQGLIAIGMHIEGGIGTQPKADFAAMLLWDYKTEKKIWEGTLDKNIFAYNSLLRASNGILYGTALDKENSSTLFAFDPAGKNFTRRIRLAAAKALDLSLMQGPDGKLYGFTDNYLYTADPMSLDYKVLYTSKGLFEVPGPIIDKDIYFASGQKLMAIRLFK